MSLLLLILATYIFIRLKLVTNVYIVQRLCKLSFGLGFPRSCKGFSHGTGTPVVLFLVFLNFLYSILPNDFLAIALVAPWLKRWSICRDLSC